MADDTPEQAHNIETASRNISPTDPAAQPSGPAFYAYSTNYLIDLSAGIIMDVEATPAHRTPEVNSTRTMVDRVEERFGVKPRRLVGDTAYGTAPLLGWMVADMKRVAAIPGVGLLTATAAIGTMGEAKAFKSAREFCAWLGLVPKQRGTGGRVLLLGISKRGDTYLRTLLIQGARSGLANAKEPGP